MKSLQPYTCKVTLIGRCLAAASGAYAQVSSINSVIITSHVFNDVPGAVFTGVNRYPGFISLSEAGVSQTTCFADRAVWDFSHCEGAGACEFQNNDYFSAYLRLTLADRAAFPRKQARRLF